MLKSQKQPLRTIIVINDPDLKIPGISKPTEFCRWVASCIIFQKCQRHPTTLANHQERSHATSLPAFSIAPYRAIVSAIDGMIDAEKACRSVQWFVRLCLINTFWQPWQETDTKSNLINFTATFSFGQCTVWSTDWMEDGSSGTDTYLPPGFSKACKGSSKPALGQACRIATWLRYIAINSSAETCRENRTPKSDLKWSHILCKFVQYISALLKA